MQALLPFARHYSRREGINDDLQNGAGTVDDVMLQNIPEGYLKSQEPKFFIVRFSSRPFDPSAL